MKFEITNSIGRTVMNCSEISCIPDIEQLESMSKLGYIFKMNCKVFSLKKMKEFKQGNE